jgi:hypothetical protein
MKTLSLLAAAALFATTWPVHALTGLDLEQFCDAPRDSTAAISCFTYIRGLTDGLYMADKMEASGVRLCWPKDQTIEPEQSKLIVQKYLKDHPEQLDRNAGALAALAIYLAFRCK